MIQMWSKLFDFLRSDTDTKKSHDSVLVGAYLWWGIVTFASRVGRTWASLTLARWLILLTFNGNMRIIDGWMDRAQTAWQRHIHNVMAVHPQTSWCWRQRHTSTAKTASTRAELEQQKKRLLHDQEWQGWRRVDVHMFATSCPICWLVLGCRCFSM